MGKRLGLNTTKTLVSVCGEPLIIRTLKLLDNVKDVRIVVGYQADKVIETVKKYREDVVFEVNHNYMNTGAAASVSCALNDTKEYVLTIVGDLIIYPDDMKMILEHDGEFICGTTVSTDDPVKITVTDGNVTEISRDRGNFEWTGICCIKRDRIKPSNKHVYQMIEHLLPIKHLFIRTKEIDTPDDYNRAVAWVKNNFKD